MLHRPLLLAGLGLALSVTAPAQTIAEDLHRTIQPALSPRVIESAMGITRRETQIPCLLTADDLDYNTRKTRVLLIGGLDGSRGSVQTVVAAMRWFYTAPAARALRRSFAISAVPVANPDGWASAAGPGDGSGGNPTTGYPPKGEAYSSPTDPEAAYLWRWIGMHAPDLVVDVRSGPETRWYVPESQDPQLRALAKILRPAPEAPAAGALAAALVRTAPSDTGVIPAVEVHWAERGQTEWLRLLLTTLARAQFHGPSPARSEIQRRLARSPVEVAEQLSRRYGHDLNDVAYQPALALIGRIWLGELTKDPQQLADVENIVAPYFSGAKKTIPKKASSVNFAGHLVFGELARATGKSRYVNLAREAADYGFDEHGAPKEALPGHNEMSDAVFMGGPIEAQVGRLTGEAKYYDMSLRNMRFLLALDLRSDGLYRHSPLNQAAWGRGNGFPALGLALSLSYFPPEQAGREEILRAFRAHMAALARFQDPTGAWHEVIDVPGSYRELTATCMIGFSMLRGVRSGWLEKDRYLPLAEKAWHAVRTRVAPDGGLVDVCISTGKQPSLRAYLDRTAILGPDQRGGAMALLIATEVARWQAENPGWRP
jgi:unsaturated rhamnogalacturonyl hydrolase